MLRGDYLKWSADGISLLDTQAGYWEFEGRNSNPSNVWGSIIGSISNLPAFYVDAPDEDDRAWGTHSQFYNLYASNTYYGQISFNPVSTYAGNNIVIESEVGTWLIIDGLPSYYEQYPTPLYTVAGGVVSIWW